MRFTIIDPTGNITALVESLVASDLQPEAARRIMLLHPSVEQVGFVRFIKPDEDVFHDVVLRMAGGEFCGNATMSAAALYAERLHSVAYGDGSWHKVRCAVSGVRDVLDVRIRCLGSGLYATRIKMPQAQGIESIELVWDNMSSCLPLVRIPGISHLVIEEGSPFFALRYQSEEAERAIQTWCEQLGASGLGLMFVRRTNDQRHDRMALTPLVYVPASGTVFWENSCASGTSAVGMYLASICKTSTKWRIKEPGGYLEVACDLSTGETWLEGTARIDLQREERV